MTRSRLVALLAVFGGLLSIAPPVCAELLLKPDDVVAVCVDAAFQQRMVAVDIESYFLMCQPVKGVRVIQAGFKEDSIESFMKRVETDLAPFQPSVVLTSHGTGEGAGKDRRGLTFYRPLYQAWLLENLKKIGARTIVLGSSRCVDSFYFQNNREAAAAWNADLAAFRDVDREIAAKAGVVFADIYDATIAAMPRAKALYGEKYNFGGADGISPAANVQLIMAYGFLKALGCDGSIGTITVDLAAKKAEGTPGHKILSFENGVVEVESVRYPFCFQGVPDQPEATSGIIASFPFNADLNRFELVVKGLAGARAKVTWGSQSREFATAELEKGVNLASAFAARTPFDAQFGRVQESIWRQQQVEPFFVESFFHHVDDFKKMAPGEAAAIDRLGPAIVEKDRKQNEAAAALVTPIRHALKIEAIQ